MGDRSRVQVNPRQHSDVKPPQSIADTSDLGTSEYTKSPTKNSSNGTLSTHATVDLDSPRGSNSVGAAASTCIKSPTTAPPSTGPAWRRTLRREDAAPNSSLLSAAIPTVVSGAIKKPFPMPKTIVAPRNHIQETPVAVISMLRAVPIAEAPKPICRTRRAFPSSTQRPAIGAVTTDAIDAGARAAPAQNAVCPITDWM